MSQRSRLTAQATAEFAAAVRIGKTFQAAAELIGVQSRTARGWVTRGANAPDSMYGAFARAVAAAVEERERTLTEAELVQVMEAAARRGSVRAATWLLERQWPERWRLANPAGKAEEDADGAQPADPFGKLDELAPRREARTKT